MTNKKDTEKKINETEMSDRLFFDKNSTFSSQMGSAIKPGSNEFQGELVPGLLEQIIKMSATEASRKVDELFRKEQLLISERTRKSTELLTAATKMIESVQASHDRVSVVVIENKAQLEKTQEIASRAEHEISSIKVQAVSAMALFVSFFAFITISINIFSKASSVFSAACLLVVFWMLLVGFNIMIGWQLKSIEPTKTHMLKLIAVVILSFTAIATLYFYHIGFSAVKSPISTIA